MDRHLIAIRKTRARLESICKTLGIVSLIVFILYCVAVAAIILCMAFPPSGFSRIGPLSPLDLVPFVANTAATGLAIFVFWRLFAEIGRGSSPFNPLRIRQTQVLGMLFLLSAVANFFAFPSVDVGVSNGEAHMLLNSTAQPPSDDLNIDLSSIAASIICFALSLIFKYGSTLECEADDLV